MRARHTHDESHRASCILVVEDDGLSRRILQSWIESLGHGVDAVASGEEALAILAKRTYDLLLIDCHLPGVDGFELARRVRETEGGDSRVPMVAMTASQAAGENERCAASGFDHLVRKPLDQARLEAALLDWVAGRAGEPAPEQPPALRPAQDLPHLDRDTLRRAAGGSEAQAEELAAELVVALEKRVLLLTRLVEGSEWQMVAKEGHRIMGSCGTLGALRLAEIAAHLREQAEAGDSRRVRSMLEELRREVAAVQADATG